MDHNKNHLPSLFEEDPLEFNDESTDPTIHHDEISEYDEFQRLSNANQNLERQLENQHDIHGTELETIRQQHIQHVLALNQLHSDQLDTLRAVHDSILNSARMAHASQLAHANTHTQQLLLRIQDLEQTVQIQQHELDTHADIDAQMRQVELRTQRLVYVDQFTDKFKAATNQSRLPPPVRSLLTDFMSNELLEDMSKRPLTVGKMSFELQNYDLPLERLIKVGIYASNKYLEVHDRRPPKFERFVGGNPIIEVNYYTEDDRWILEDAFKRERLDQIGVPASGLANWPAVSGV